MVQITFAWYLEHLGFPIEAFKGCNYIECIKLTLKSITNNPVLWSVLLN